MRLHNERPVGEVHEGTGRAIADTPTAASWTDLTSKRHEKGGNEQYAKRYPALR
jgi:hypothetical protein